MSARLIPVAAQRQTVASLLAGCPVTFHDALHRHTDGSQCIVTTAAVHHPVGKIWIPANHPQLMELLEDIGRMTK